MTRLASIIDVLPSNATVVLWAVLFLLLAVVIGIALSSLVLIRRVAYPLYDAELRKAEREAADIVAAAKRKAAMLVKERESEMEQLITKHDRELKKRVEHYAAELGKYPALAQETQRRFNAVAKQTAAAGEAAATQEMNRLFTELRGQHEELRKQFTQRFSAGLERELAAVREVTDAYRESQLRMIDKRIVALVERSAAIAFQKELSVSEHAELVYQSLEEAKRQGVI